MNNRETNQYFFELNELLSERYKEEVMEESDLKSPSFFISHNQLDSKQAQKIVVFLKSLGISKERIFCSSVQSTGIPGQADINDYIKTQLNDNCFFIFLLSSLLVLAACGKNYEISDITNKFKKEGLSVENLRKMEREDFGMAPMKTENAKIFTVSEDKNARILKFKNEAYF